MFSKKTGIHLSTYQHYEADKRKPNVNVILKIAKACDVTSDWLLGLSKKQNGEKNAENLPLRTGAKRKIEELKEYADQASAKATELLAVIGKMEETL